jgi:cyclopropane fatty-acyl-phospholipid synthase-like methyltransferase
MYSLIADTIKNRRFPNYETLSQFADRTGFLNNIKAKHLATNNKRLDICAAQFAQLLHLAQTGGLEGKTCLEVGSGWVLSHALVCHLLGAERVIATDIYPMAHYARLYEAVHQSVSYFVRDILAPFSEHQQLRERLDRLLAIRHFSPAALNKLGIYYHAPFDFSERQYDEPVDFIWSFSVFSHIPASLVEAIAANLHASLRLGGSMMHAIHLEDTRSLKEDPFAFYRLSEAEYPVKFHSIRGNRLRASQWEKMFDRITHGKTRTLYRWTRSESTIPDKINASIEYTDRKDLRTSHIGILAYR